jgi:hypothetical protein
VLQQRLDEALAAQHDLLSLKKPVRIDNGGQSREFSPGNAKELEAYIGQLYAALRFKITGAPTYGAFNFSIGGRY